MQRISPRHAEKITYIHAVARAGQLIVAVGVAPLHPAEFVVIEIGLFATPPT